VKLDTKHSPFIPFFLLSYFTLTLPYQVKLDYSRDGAAVSEAPFTVADFPAGF
jgi:hypothetical protein